MIFFTKPTKVIALRNRSVKSDPNFWGTIFFKSKEYFALKTNCRSPTHRTQKLLNFLQNIMHTLIKFLPWKITCSNHHANSISKLLKKKYKHLKWLSMVSRTAVKLGHQSKAYNHSMYIAYGLHGQRQYKINSILKIWSTEKVLAIQEKTNQWLI